MRRTKTVRRIVIVAALAGAGALLVQYTPSSSAAARGNTAPKFSSKATVKAKNTKALNFTIKTKATPTATVTQSGPLPYGLTFSAGPNGTATLSGTVPLSGSYSISLAAQNSLGTTDQTLTLNVTSKLPAIRHVFVIMLENNDYAATFGNPSADDPIWRRRCLRRVCCLENYYGVGHFSNDNYIGFISGQPPNSDNQSDCIGGLVAFPPATARATASSRERGASTRPVSRPSPTSSTREGLTWKGYMEDMGNDPTREAANCGHPAVGSSDPSFNAEASRRLRHPPRPVRLLPLDHRQHRRVRRERRAPG